jgi:ketosteroid isomerase-like protein
MTENADERLRAVQTLWTTYRESGAAVAAELLHPEVEFITAEGRAYKGPDEVRAFFAEFEERGESFIASPFTFELHDPDVLVVGHRRIRGPKAMRGDYLYFVHGIRDGRVSRLTAHLSREDAIADVARRRGP